MRIRTAFLTAAIAALPVLALAQTAAPPVAPPAETSPSAAPDQPRHDHARHQQRHAEARARYEKLSDADKARFDELTKQIRQLQAQRMQILGLGKS
jgi:hypothetical protein